MKLREALQKGCSFLTENGISEPEENAWQLLSFVTGMDRGRYLLSQREEFSQEEEYGRLLKRRAGHEPLQYITGTQGFMGLEFQVSPAVLIPRQDTETLVEEALKDLLSGKNLSPRILDVCTGSGCIGISIFVHLSRKGIRPDVTLTDLSEEALKVAEKNARLLSQEVQNSDSPQLMQNVGSLKLLQGDLLEKAEGEYDLIVSNPPYIPTEVIGGLMEEVRDFEPRMALDGEADGLYFYRRLAKEAPLYLKEGGHLLLEIGYDQGEQVSGLLKAAGFTDVQVIRDLCGKDRVVKGRKAPFC